MVKDESHIQTTGVQTPDTERVSAQSGQRDKGHGKSVGSIRAKGEKRETWVSRHYDLRTELGGGRPK